MAELLYDVVVIGAGAAGSTAVSTIVEQERGMKVALIERDKMGGTCLNYGCDPTKTLLFVANLLQQIRHAERYGIEVPSVSVQWEKVQEYVRSVLAEIRGSETDDQAREEQKKQGVDVFQGEARFLSAHEIEVTQGSREDSGRERYTLRAEQVIIATGDETVIPRVEGLQEAGFITNVQAVALETLPRRLAILGGGSIGIEFAQMFRRFGVDVVVLEHSTRLLEKEDHEVGEALVTLLRAEGIRAETETELVSVRREDDGKHVRLRIGEHEEEEMVVDEILVAIGRKPAIETLNLEAAGIETTKKGISVDATLRTNVPHIWAIGDVTGGYQFTHVASDQAELVASNVLAKHPQPFGDRIIPWVTYTNPPLAHIGKTEEELHEGGVEYKVGRVHFKEVERAVLEDQTEGMVKLLVDAEGKILGAHILGAHADDLLAPIAVAMQANLKADMLASTLLPYPTLSECIRAVVGNV